MTGFTNRNSTNPAMDVNAKRELLINCCRNIDCDECMIDDNADMGCMYWEFASDSVIEKVFQEFSDYCAERKIKINSITDSQMVYTKIWKAFNKKINNTRKYNKNLYGGQATLHPTDQSTSVAYWSSKVQNEKLKDKTNVSVEPAQYSWEWKENEYGYECPACHCFFDYNSTYGIFDHNYACASYCPNCGVKMMGGENA